MSDCGRAVSGMLDVGDGQRIHWEQFGDSAAKPAVVLHGGPGSGSSVAWRRFFDLESYRVVFFDQRGCGRSTPDAADAGVELSVNTAAHLISDIERLREHLGIPRWLVFGGSWGSTLALAYAERFVERVSELVLFSVVTTTAREVEWVTRDMGRLVPEAWERFRDGLPVEWQAGSLVEGYAKLLADPSETVRARAARDWCDWEDAHVRGVSVDLPPDPRYEDPRFRLRFARLVTHYWRHAGFLPDGQLVAGAGALASVPGVMVHGRADLSSPLDVPLALSRAWPGSELVVVSDALHGLGSPGVTRALTDALSRFALR